jgi:hypothetical protein
MLKISHVKLLAVIMTLSVWSESSAQDISFFEGFVLDDQEVALPYCHVINLSRPEGGISGADGYFSIKAEAGDSIKITFLGYKNMILVIDAEMMQRNITAKLQPDYIELQSVWVFSDHKYKVPKRPKFKSYRLGSLPQYDGTESIKPGDFTWGTSSMNQGIGPSLTLHGPFTYLSKEEKEKRTAQEAYLNTFETINFSKLMALQKTRKLLKGRYELADSELDRLIVMMNLELPEIQRIKEPSRIFAYVDRFIGKKVSQIGWIIRP